MANIAWLSVADSLAKGEPAPGMNLFEVYSGPFPMTTDDPIDTDRTKVELTAVRIYRAQVDDSAFAVVIGCRIRDGAPEWGIYCGDESVEGSRASDGPALARKLRDEGTFGVKLCNAIEASPWQDKVARTASCGYHRMIVRSPERLCSHTRMAFSQVTADELNQMATDLMSWMSGTDLAGLAVSERLTDEEQTVMDSAFIQHVMLAGERGSGKTFLARRVADKLGAVYLEMQMHPSMESWEVRTHDRACEGKIMTVMGKLAEAVYLIKEKNQRVVLCLDEFFNMNPMHTTVFNTPLSLTERDTYMIETGRVIPVEGSEGLARIETVEVPANMLWIIATTNIGARYNLDKIPPSIRARFLIVLMNSDAARTKSIIEQNLIKYEMPMELAAGFQKFMTACNQAVDENLMDEEATTRLACNVLRNVYLVAKRDAKAYTSAAQWLPVIRKQMMREAAQVVNFELGSYDSEQMLQFNKLVETAFV